MKEWIDLLKSADAEDYISVFVFLPLMAVILLTMVVLFQ